jgi:isopenicillin-N N-acyltransferase-like protein
MGLFKNYQNSFLVSTRTSLQKKDIKLSHRSAASGILKDMIFNRILIGGLAGLILAICFSGCVSSVVKHTEFYKKRIATEPVERKVVNEGRVEKIGRGTNEITVLYLKGSHYEMGFQHGKLLKDDLRDSLYQVLGLCYELVEEKIGLPLLGKAMTNCLLDEAYKRMEPYIPKDDKEEMEGLADGSGISLQDIHRVHAIPGLTETSCSAIAAFGKATQDGNLYQLRVLDYITELGIQEHPTITVYQPDEGNPFVNIGWAGFIGVISGMNKEGIAISEMGYGGPGDEQPGIPTPAPKETLGGVPMIFLLKNVLRYADNVEQATGIMRSAEKTNYYVYVIGDGITESGNPEVRGYISTKKFCRVYKANDPKYPIPALDDVVYGSHYNEKCYQLLEALYGQIGPSVIMDRITPDISMQANLQCVVYDPKNLRFWVANAEGTEGRACEQDYVLFDFGKALTCSE